MLNKSQDKRKVNQIYNIIKKTINKNKASLHEPFFLHNEKKYLSRAIESNYVSTRGKYISEFSKGIKKITKSKYVVPVVNGTSALHISLKCLKINSNHEVLVPSLTFVATANAISYLNANPHFVDCEESTLGVNADKLRLYLNKITTNSLKGCLNKKTKKIIRALIVTHVFGHPANLDKLKQLCNDFKIILIEDAAGALGSFYKKKHVGTFGQFGILSFNGNKIITTGGGGVILANKKKDAVKAKHISSTAKVNHKWKYLHDEVGFNYRLPNLNAALGCAQIKKLNTFIKKKRKLYKKYKKNFSQVNYISLFSEPKKCRSNYWLQTLILNKKNKKLRNKILNYTNHKGLETRPTWCLLHKLKHFKNCQKMNLKISEDLEKRIINIPSGTQLINI
tara:strand:- start:869 stop:2050 length:1182 start_codon:yes stop_codon:yes gene_type:complete